MPSALGLGGQRDDRVERLLVIVDFLSRWRRHSNLPLLGVVRGLELPRGGFLHLNPAPVFEVHLGSFQSRLHPNGIDEAVRASRWLTGNSLLVFQETFLEVKRML